MDAAADGDGVDSADGEFAGFLRRAAGTQLLDDEKTAADADDFLAHAGRTRGAGRIVNIKPGTDDRRITHAPRQFVRQARSAAHAAQRAFLIKREHGDGIVIVGSAG